jgi:hypothetical protein
MKLLRSPWIRLALFGLICFLLIFALQISWSRSYRDASGIARSFAPFGDELRRADGSVDFRATLNKALGTPLPKEQNSAAVYAVLAARRDLSDPKLRGLVLRELGISESEFALGGAFLQAWETAEKFEQNAYQTIWTNGEEYPAMAAWLDQYPAELAELRKASHLQWYSPLVNSNPDNPIITDLLPLVQSQRIASRMLLTSGFREAARGNLDAAIADIAAVNRSSQHQQGPFLIQALVAAATRTMGGQATTSLLQQFELDDKQLETLEDSLQTSGGELGSHAEIARGERYMLLDILQTVDRGRSSSEMLSQLSGSGNGSGALLSFGFGILVDRGAVLQQLNHWYDSLVDSQDMAELQGKTLIARLDKFEQLQTWPGIGESTLLGTVKGLPGFLLSSTVRGRRIGEVLITLLGPALSQCNYATIRVSQQRRLLLLAIAVERYRCRHGDYPEALPQLVPDFLPELPIDQFADSGTFGYVRSADGFRVYANPTRPKSLPNWGDIKFEIVIDRREKQAEQPDR